MKRTKVLVVATSRNTRGGITSVIKAHECGRQWKEFNCKWIATHIDRNVLYKIYYLVKGWFSYIMRLPFFDIVHIHTSEVPSALRKSLFVIFARLFRKKIIVHFHAFSSDTTINGPYQWLYRYLFTHADLIIVLSEWWKNQIEEVFPLKDKVQVLYNPCTTTILPHIYEKRPQILYAGTVNDRKGYKDLIKAFSKLAVSYPNWQLVFAGNGEIEQGKALAKEYGISHQTIFLGWVSGAAKDKAFKEASIFCLPSYAEGLPMALLDAWAYNIPSIVTPVGGIPDIVKDGENGLIFPVGDINELQKKLTYLINNPGECERIKKAAKRNVMGELAIDTINSQLADIYRNI